LSTEFSSQLAHLRLPQGGPQSIIYLFHSKKWSNPFHTYCKIRMSN